jgi:tRNA threonylcarbamoyladenosine biosynthesis protein TsaB
MLILGIDTTTLACSVALLNNETVLAEATLNIKKTHSERLMPLLNNLLSESGIEHEALEAIAVAAGPGSFTGIRIGVSTARALAQGLSIPAVPVCTLEAMAEAVPTPGSLICPLLDARRNQVYTALYRRNFDPPFALQTVNEPAALTLDELVSELKVYDQPVIFLGEGLNSYASALENALPPERVVITTVPFRLCRASSVALVGQRLLAANPQASYNELLPIYLRRPEAERMADREQSARQDES